MVVAFHHVRFAEQRAEFGRTRSITKLQWICNELELIWVTQIGLARLYHPKKVRIGQIMYGQPLKRFPMLPQVFAGVEGVGGVVSLPVPCGPASNTFSGNKVV